MFIKGNDCRQLWKFPALRLHSHRTRRQLASRIESSCNPGGTYISREVARQLSSEEYAPAGRFRLKGIDEEVELFHLR